MPSAPSMTSTEQDKEEAFQVLNQDNLPIAVIGQPILKPFNPEFQKFKPNVIVHPTRRISNNLEENKQKPFTKSSGFVNNNGSDKISNKNGGSHANLYHNNSTTQMKLDDLQQLDLEHFNKTLDSKLKRLQKEENKQKKTNSEPSTFRKPFVTTVKKGQFLEPPPEIASLIGIRLEEQKYVKKNPKEVNKLYAFASHPRVLSRTPPKNVHQTKCEAAAWAPTKLVGAVVAIRHEDNLKTRDLNAPQEKKLFKEKNNSSALADQDDPDLANTRIEQAQRRALARKRARNQQNIQPKQNLNSTSVVSDVVHDRLLDINQLQRLLIARDFSDAATQTEVAILQENTESKTLRNDVQIQVHPTDLFDFDIEVQPIVEILVTKTIEEALIEVLEEEEMLAMKQQQRKFLDYMAQKVNENSDVEADIDKEIIENLPRGIVQHNYTPTLITSV